MKPFQQALTWIDQKYLAGAKQIGVSCNPIQRKLFLAADEERLTIDCPYSQREVRILKDTLHDYIGGLETLAKNAEQRGLKRSQADR